MELRLSDLNLQAESLNRFVEFHTFVIWEEEKCLGKISIGMNKEESWKGAREKSWSRQLPLMNVLPPQQLISEPCFRFCMKVNVSFPCVKAVLTFYFLAQSSLFRSDPPNVLAKPRARRSYLIQSRCLNAQQPQPWLTSSTNNTGDRLPRRYLLKAKKTTELKV